MKQLQKQGLSLPENFLRWTLLVGLVVWHNLWLKVILLGVARCYRARLARALRPSWRSHRRLLSHTDGPVTAALIHPCDAEQTESEAQRDAYHHRADRPRQRDKRRNPHC